MATNFPSTPPRGLAFNCLERAAGVLRRLSRPAGPVLAAAWYALIFSLSSQQGVARPGPFVGSWILNTGHAFLFGMLALWLALALPRRDGWPVVSRSGAIWVLALVLALGVLDELHQASVPGRRMALTDVFTDMTGAACVLWTSAYAPSRSASERGLRARLLLCVACCAAAGAIATLVDD